MTNEQEIRKNREASDSDVIWRRADGQREKLVKSKREREKERERDKQLNRQTVKQTDSQTGIQAYKTYRRTGQLRRGERFTNRGKWTQ